jgi:hypothetical protein
MFLFPLIFGCKSDYGINDCGDTDCVPKKDEDTSSTNGHGSGGPAFSSCDFSDFVLPIDSDSNESSFNDICPLYYRGEFAGNYVEACKTSLNQRLTAISDASQTYFSESLNLSDIDVVLQLLQCQMPLTAFYEFAPSANQESTKLYVALGDERDSIAAYTRGELVEPFPFPSFFFFGEKTGLDADTESAQNVSVSHGVSNAEKEALPFETNSFAISRSPEDQLDLNVNEKIYTMPCDDCDYTLTTSETRIQEIHEDLSATVKALLEVKKGETKTVRGGEFFPPEN